jgi:glucokinase
VTKRAREELGSWRGPTTLKPYGTANDDELTSKVVFDLAAAGDACAQKVVDDTAYYLALGACAAIAVVDPEVIVFGGGMIAAGEPFRNQIDEYVRRFGLPHPVKKVKVLFAELGSDAGFIGAAGCVKLMK